jgi:hypothetical protein
MPLLPGFLLEALFTAQMANAALEDGIDFRIL